MCLVAPHAQKGDLAREWAHPVAGGLKFHSSLGPWGWPARPPTSALGVLTLSMKENSQLHWAGIWQGSAALRRTQSSRSAQRNCAEKAAGFRAAVQVPWERGGGRCG